MRLTVIFLAALLAGAPGCSDSADDDIRAHVTLAVNQEGREARQAAEYLARYGKKAIPTIEAAMHTASPEGRKNLIFGLRKIADPEAIPLLQHIAQYDGAADVRREAEWTLRQWAAGPAADPKTGKSRAAVRSLDEAKGSEEAG